MSDTIHLNRRGFLLGAGAAALGGAAGSVPATAIAGAAAAKAGTKVGAGGAVDLDEVYDRVGSNCYKWDRQIQRFGEEQFDIGMGIADMDFRCAPCITEALHERVNHENWGYMNHQDSLKEAIAEWNRVRHGVDVDPGIIQLAAGVHPGLIAALRAISPPGSKVLMNSPTYNGFYSDLEWTRTLRNDSEMWIDDDGVYQIDWDDLEARMTPDTFAMMLCNPQNPTGNCWSQEDLLRIGELCLKHQVVVLADEIHCDFVMNGQKYTPFASLPDKAIVDNSLTFKAISKTFSLAGMKNAYFFSTNPVLLERVRRWHRADINTLGVVANEAAYRRGAPWFDRVRAYIDGNHAFVEQFVRDRIPGMRYRKAQGTYLAWLDVGEVARGIGAERHARAHGLESAEHFCERWLVERAGVQLNPGSDYGTGGAGHMRMNVGAPRPLIAQALERIEDAVRRV
jgi:cystathionine beta-lyase